MGRGRGCGCCRAEAGKPLQEGEGESGVGAEPVSRASMPVGCLALLFSALGLRMARKRVEGARGRAGLLGEGLKRVYDVTLCQVGKDTLSPPVFILETDADKASTVLVAQRGQGSWCCERPVGVPGWHRRRRLGAGSSGSQWAWAWGRASGTGSDPPLRELGLGPLPASQKGRCRASGEEGLGWRSQEGPRR